MKEALELLPRIVGFVTAAIFCMAFLREWAYFGVIGYQFQALLSVTDYFTTAIAWLPTFVIIWLFVGLMYLADWRSRGFMVRPIAKTWTAAWWANDAPFVLTGWFLTIVAIVQFLFGSIYVRGPIEVAVMIFWFRFCAWLVHEKMADYLNMSRALMLIYIPPLLFIAYWGGLIEGFEALSKIDRTHIVRLKNEQDEKNLIVLRNLTHGIVYRDWQLNRISYIKWDDISLFSVRVNPPDTRGFTCRWFGVICPPVQATTP